MQSYRDKIEKLKKESHFGDSNRMAQALDDAIQLLYELDEERESLWQLLDELKASDVKNHAAAQKESINEAINRAQSLLIAKVAKA
jgi:ATP/maltotriose-dependent transcriptional regulator MalT